MESVKFSVLLPTKNRLELLKYAIQSVLSQSYSNFEIIVSDNFSDEDIGTWCRSLNDDRIVYYRQDHPVSVTDNWNTANDMASGDYIIMLGDDDALVPDALKILNQNIRDFNFPEIICFSAYHYLQPGTDPQRPDGDVYRTTFIPIEKAEELSVEWRKDYAEKCLNFKAFGRYNMQYCCYSKKNVDRLKKYGNYYEPPYPDYYTTCMNFVLCDRFVYIPDCITVIGITPKSYGYFYLNNKEKDGMKFHNESDFRTYAHNSLVNKLCSVDEMDTAALVTFAIVTERLNWSLPSLYDYYKRVIYREIYTFNDDFGTIVLPVFKNEIYPNLNQYEKNTLTEYMINCYKNAFASNHEEKLGLSYNNILELLNDISHIEETQSKYIGEFRDLKEWSSLFDWKAFDSKVKSRKILLWGAYNRSRYLKSILEQRGYTVSGFIDKEYAYDIYENSIVYKPEDVICKANRDKYYIIIPLLTYYKDICDILLSSGFGFSEDFEYIYNHSDILATNSYSDIYGNRIIGSNINLSNCKVTFCGKDCSLEIRTAKDIEENVQIVIKGQGTKVVIDDSTMLFDKSCILVERSVILSDTSKETSDMFIMDCASDCSISKIICYTNNKISG